MGYSLVIILCSDVARGASRGARLVIAPGCRMPGGNSPAVLLHICLFLRSPLAPRSNWRDWGASRRGQSKRNEWPETPITTLAA